MIEPGRFIVVEGLEGAGKTTAMTIIQEYLSRRIPSLIITREPGGTRLGEQLRTLIKEGVESEPIEHRAELLMMYAARVQLVEQIIRPALVRGDWVLADRFELSSYAYQGNGRGIDRKILDNLSDICLQGFKPDIIIFLDIKPEQGLERIKIRGKTDRIEQESLVFFRKVYQGYHEAIKKLDNVCIIDASASIDEVKNAIIRSLESVFSIN